VSQEPRDAPSALDFMALLGWHALRIVPEHAHPAHARAPRRRRLPLRPHLHASRL